MGIAFDITASDTTVTHGLGTRDILVQAWQNNYLVHPDLAQRDDNTLRVFANGATETSPIRLLVFPIGTGYTDPTEPSKPSSVKETDTKEESSGIARRTEGSTKADEAGSTATGETSKGSGKRRSTKPKAS